MGRCVKCGRDWPKGYRACPDDGAKIGLSIDPLPGSHTPPALTAVAEGPADLASGTVIGEYIVEGKLGEGGMGAVYAARHPVIGKKAAIKVISPQLCADPAAIERFVQEARSVNQIGHPNIVDVFSFGELQDRRSYFVMEWLGGESLGDRMARERVPYGEAIEILDQIADALDAAHEAGIIHRDLKPDNVFLVQIRGGRQIVKLLDFGIAKLAGTGDVRVQRTRTGVMMGTPAYMSPEQARGKNVDHRTDVYALGALAYELILGVLPFDADNAMDIVMQHLTDPPPPPRAHWGEIPPSLESLLLALLSKDPAERPTLHHVRETLTELRSTAFGGAPSGSRTGAIARPATPAPSRVMTPAPSPSAVLGTAPTVMGTPSTAITAEAATAPSTSTLPPEPEHAARRSRLPLWIALGSVVAAGGVAVGASIANRPGATKTATAVAPEPTPPPPAPIAPLAPDPRPEPKPAATEAPAPTTLVVTVDAPDARIELDGVVVAESANGARITVKQPGAHALVVTAPNRKKHAQTVTVAEGTTVEVSVELERATTRPPRPPKPRTGDPPPKDCVLDLDGRCR